MVVIRLARAGAKKRPFYYLTVADSRRALSGAFLERLGYTQPCLRKGQEPVISVNRERLDYWLSVGAQMTGSVKRLLKGA
ncbi:MAG: 30S ribosomal protein S16 [Kistimonas sp.]|nr:30S ribosomal protein S16 [Kistimonas sp.]